MSDQVHDGASAPSGGWHKVLELADRLGRALLEKALVAYFVAVDPKTPPQHKAALFAALSYLGMPLDAIPDVTPMVGFTDDAAALIAALIAVALSVRVRHVRAARRAMRGMGVKAEEVDQTLDDDEGWAGAW